MALAAVEADAAAAAPGLNPPFSPEQHELALESLLEFCRCVPDGCQRHTSDAACSARRTRGMPACRNATCASCNARRRTACTVSERAACAVPRATTASPCVAAAALPSR
jgi:hypothetical protein